CNFPKIVTFPQRGPKKSRDEATHLPPQPQFSRDLFRESFSRSLLFVEAAARVHPAKARRIAMNIARLPELLSLICRCTPYEARERLRPHNPKVFCHAKSCSSECD